MNATDKTNQFLAVLDAHKGILYKVANAYCPDPEDRRDLVQEITIQLWRSFERYTDQYRYSTWIYRVALNVAISFYRKENRRQRTAHAFAEGLLNSPSTPDEPNENLRQLHAFIAELRELDKALMLLYLEEKSYPEIAETLGLSETNVATKISRIKNLLKQKFSTLKKQ